MTCEELRIAIIFLGKASLAPVKSWVAKMNMRAGAKKTIALHSIQLSRGATEICASSVSTKISE